VAALLAAEGSAVNDLSNATHYLLETEVPNRLALEVPAASWMNLLLYDCLRERSCSRLFTGSALRHLGVARRVY